MYSNTTTDETSINEAKKISQEYLKWRKEDRFLYGWIIGSLNEEALGLVTGLESSQSVWNAFKEAYAQDSQERKFTLRQQLTYLRKDIDQSLAEHLEKFKSICDSLAAIGNPIPNKTKVYSLLANLGPKYESFTTAMHKPPMPSYSEAVSLLQGFEQRNTWVETSHSPPYAFYGQLNQNQQQTYNSRNRQNNQFTSIGRGFQAINNNF
ncbi:Retrotransposon gag protein [Abeliophyllum distichum]|uniref:Retrotransposon gag protein n=1 Tax=Abeliophyllum distichum TaxID=126358 RepID=A0ABD1UMS5_9LAMI